MRNNFDVVTWDDKSKRDTAFADRDPGTVKFSSCRPLLTLPDLGYGAPGEIAVDNKGRVRYISTWSIATPIR